MTSLNVLVHFDLLNNIEILKNFFLLGFNYEIAIQAFLNVLVPVV